MQSPICVSAVLFLCSPENSGASQEHASAVQKV